MAGVDVGGGGVRVRVAAAGRTAQRSRPGRLPRRKGRVDVPALCERILVELRAAMAELAVPDLTALGVGMTGIPGMVDDAEEVDAHVRRGLSIRSVGVASDALTTHLGALGRQPGTVVAAGTGIVALATDHADSWHQIDGWGVLLGDEGSGAWIGRRGLQAALRSIDGRSGGSTLLAARLRKEYGGPLDLLARVYPSASPGYELAAFAPAVASAARAGDAVAAAIWQEAGAALGRTAVAGARQVHPRISWGGGLFRAGDLLIEPFRRAVLQVIPEAELLEPRGTALDGALTLARRAASGVPPRPPHLYVFA